MANKVGVSKKPAGKFDIGLALVIGAASFQSYQFGRALNVYDPGGWAIQGVNIGGLILGVIVNVIIALAAIKLPQITAAAIKTNGKADKKSKTKNPNERKQMKAVMQARFAQVAFCLLLTLSPFLVAPALYLLWSGLPLQPELIACLCVGWAMAPDLGIALGGFIEGKSLVHLSDAPARTSARSATDSPKKSYAGATDSAKSASDSVGLGRTYPRRCAHCATDSANGLLKSANAVGGHMKKHHPELCKPRALAETLFDAEVKA